MKTFADFGIVVGSNDGHTRTVCPQCSPNRRKSGERCLSVDVDEGVFLCHHCGWSGSLKEGKGNEEIVRHFKRPEFKWTELPQDIVDWFVKRGISERTLRRAQIGYGPSFGKKYGIQFPYYKGGAVVNIKHRTLDKEFRQESGAEKCLYLFDEIAKGGDTLIITEGEIDALSTIEAGFDRVTSIPDGAPSAGSKTYATKFDFLESAADILAGYKRVILLCDNDAPGKTAESELARRIGVEKCYRVEYPAGCKDANDVLQNHGVGELQRVINTAQPYPVDGIFSVGSLKTEVCQLYERGENRGLSTGWLGVDKLYTVRRGELTIITGIPGHGKSTWLDALLVNLIELHALRFAIFSPENWPPERHAQSFVEKINRMPFRRDGRTVRRMTRDEAERALDDLAEYIYFIMPEERLCTVDEILSKARVLIARHGINGLVIDPWNEVEHAIEKGEREDQYISRSLSKIRRFARLNGVHVWVVAHPKNLSKDKDGNYKPPTMYEISGGAHWRNKADNGVCVFRNDFANDITTIIIQKVRFREVGQVGETYLKFCRDVGRYSE